MNSQEQITLSLLTACLMQQNQMLNAMDAKLAEIMEHVDSLGDGLWRMERGNRVEASPVNQARAKEASSAA